MSLQARIERMARGLAEVEVVRNAPPVGDTIVRLSLRQGIKQSEVRVTMTEQDELLTDDQIMRKIIAPGLGALLDHTGSQQMKDALAALK